MLAGRDRRAGSLEAVREGPAAGLSSACRRRLHGLHTAVSLRVCLHMALFIGIPVLFSMGHKRPRAWGTVTCGINQGSRATSCPWGPLAGSAPGPRPHYCCGRSSHPGKTFGPPRQPPAAEQLPPASRCVGTLPSAPSWALPGPPCPGAVRQCLLPATTGDSQHVIILRPWLQGMEDVVRAHMRMCVHVCTCVCICVHVGVLGGSAGT